MVITQLIARTERSESTQNGTGTVFPFTFVKRFGNQKSKRKYKNRRREKRWRWKIIQELLDKK